MFRDIRLLTRLPVSAAAAALAGFGFWQTRPAYDAALAATVAGVFLLACGASALNQVQEKDPDGRMRRTRNRPLPAGRMRLGAALAVSALYLGIGLALLSAAAPQAALAGVVAVGLYNGLYTPLKRIGPLSLPIGAVAGASPLLLGALGAGGSLDAPLLLVCFGIAVMWQIPHFWLRAARHKDDYLRAGFAVPFLTFPEPVRLRAALLWLPALGAALLLPVPFLPSLPVLGQVILGLTALIISLLPLFALRAPAGSHPALLRAADIAVCIGFLVMPAGMPAHIHF